MTESQLGGVWTDSLVVGQFIPRAAMSEMFNRNAIGVRAHAVGDEI